MKFSIFGHYVPPTPPRLWRYDKISVLVLEISENGEVEELRFLEKEYAATAIMMMPLLPSLVVAAEIFSNKFLSFY